jgi:hypothetical protein
MIAMLYGWEIVLILAVVMVLFAARRGFQPEATRWDVKRALFYFLMTLVAVTIGCLLALLVDKLGL